MARVNSALVLSILDAYIRDTLPSATQLGRKLSLNEVKTLSTAEGHPIYAFTSTSAAKEGVFRRDQRVILYPLPSARNSPLTLVNGGSVRVVMSA